MAALNLVVGFSGVNWHSPHLDGDFAFRLLVVVARFVVLWFYWNGENWARVLVLVASVATLWNLTLWAHATTYSRIIIAIVVALGLFLLYWLSTPAIKKYFDPKPTTLLS